MVRGCRAPYDLSAAHEQSYRCHAAAQGAYAASCRPAERGAVKQNKGFKFTQGCSPVVAADCSTLCKIRRAL